MNHLRRCGLWKVNVIRKFGWALVGPLATGQGSCLTRSLEVTLRYLLMHSGSSLQWNSDPRDLSTYLVDF